MLLRVPALHRVCADSSDFALWVASGFKNSEGLSFCDDVVDLDQNGFELAGGGRGDRNFHLHGFDESDVVAFANAGAGLGGDRADAPGNLGQNPDFGHSVLRDWPPAIEASNNLSGAGALSL